VSSQRRIVRATADFFEDLDRQLPSERGPNGCESPRSGGRLSGDRWLARLGAFQVIYDLDEDRHAVVVQQIDNRASRLRPDSATAAAAAAIVPDASPTTETEACGRPQLVIDPAEPTTTATTGP
jgi:mRNA-degrading endonuclease RelE of RelBE toxin-antitoxin system